MKFDPDFKKAISQLASSEKDKLILRLLKHDLTLANQLRFELLEGVSVQTKRTEMEERVRRQTDKMALDFYSPGYLLLDLRYLSGEITEHVKITRDKVGEASLNLLMLVEALQKCNGKIERFSPSKCNTLAVYVIARAFKILVLVKSLHEDFMIEFEEGLKELGRQISQNSRLMDTAIHHGLDVNWLLRAAIPDDIADVHKKLRARGYLK